MVNRFTKTQMPKDSRTMKLILQALLSVALLSALAASDDGYAYDAFSSNVLSSYFMFQRYTHLDSSNCDGDIHVTAVDQAEEALLVYNLDFSGGYATNISIQVQADCGAGAVTELFLHLDNETATPFVTVVATDTGDVWPYTYFSAPVHTAPTPGIHRVYITFNSNCLQDPIVRLHLLQFFQ